MGSNPGAIYWIESTFFHIDFFVKKCIDVCLKRPKINEKEAVLAHLKRKKNKESCIRMCVSAFIKYAALTELVIKVQRINDFSSLY